MRSTESCWNVWVQVKGSREGRGGWVGVHLHLLTEGATSNKVTNEGGHTWPPVVVNEERVSMKESPVSRGKRRMNSRDEIIASIGRNIKMVFKIEDRTGETPIGQRGARKQRGTIREIFKSRNNQGVGYRRGSDFLNKGSIDGMNEENV